MKIIRQIQIISDTFTILLILVLYYAIKVLALGGGRHPSEVYRSFRGKDASPEALLRHSGLLQEEEGPGDCKSQSKTK